MKSRNLKPKILVTGGAGYIGSHTVIKLLEKGYEVLVLDNLSNSKLEILDRIFSLTGKKVDFVRGDIKNRKIIRNIFEKFN